MKIKLSDKKIFSRAFGAGDGSVSGFSTIEILIAFAVGIVFLSAAMMVAFSGQQSPTGTGAGIYNGTSTDVGQAAALDLALDNYGLATSSNRIGKILSKLTKDWNSLTSDDSEKINNNLTYGNTSSIQDISPCMKEITSTTTWSSLNNRNHHITFGTAIGSIDQAKLYGRGGCDPTPPGDWNTLDSPPGWDVTPSELDGRGTGIAITKISGTPYAFVTTEQSGANKKDLWSIDITTTSNPNPRSNLDTGNNGLNGIAIGDQYAYVIQNDSVKQFNVVDISNPTNLAVSSIVASTTLPNMNTSCTACVTPTSIAYYDGYVFIGTPYIANLSVPITKNNEFHIFCVNDTSVLNCTPTTPRWMGSFNVNHKVSDIAITQKVVAGVAKTYAFLATSDSSGGYPELTMLDVTNPSAITLEGTADLPGNLYGTSIYALGNKVYLGRQRATGSYYDFYIFDTKDDTTISAASAVKQKKLGLGPNTAVTDILIRGKFAFLVTSDSNAPFQVWDVVSSSTAIVKPDNRPSCANTLNLSVSSGISSFDKFIYVVNKNQAALKTVYGKTTCD